MNKSLGRFSDENNYNRHLAYLEMISFAARLGIQDKYNDRKPKRCNIDVWRCACAEMNARGLEIPPNPGGKSTHRAIYNAYCAGWTVWKADQDTRKTLKRFGHK